MSTPVDLMGYARVLEVNRELMDAASVLLSLDLALIPNAISQRHLCLPWTENHRASVLRLPTGPLAQARAFQPGPPRFRPCRPPSQGHCYPWR